MRSTKVSPTLARNLLSWECAMQDDDNPPVGPSPEVWKAFLDEAERQERAHAGVQMMLRKRREARGAERLGKPPLDLADAFRRHLKTCPHPHDTEARKAWRKENPWFAFAGKRWQRFTKPIYANSGKRVTAWNTYYIAEDGERVEEVVVPGARG